MTKYSLAPPRASRAFTLIELLTVIAIIGILAAILIPTVGTVRKTAKGAHCVANLRQIGVAINLYPPDNKGYYPRLKFNYASDDNTKKNNLTWAKALYPYIPTRNTSAKALTSSIYLCPAEEYQPDPSATGVIQYMATYVLEKTNATDEGAPNGPRLASSIPNPSRTFLLLDVKVASNGEIPAGGGGTGVNFTEGQADMAAAPEGRKILSFRHKEGINVLFIDGHTKRYTLEGLKTAVPNDPTGQAVWDGDKKI
jgi:prepilin-type N-terminal cleavage/methylation domain-containing protein/prepilin-type processing-associated H-X9-DG protein